MIISLPFHCSILSPAPDNGRPHVSKLGKREFARHEVDRLDMIDIEVNWGPFLKAALRDVVYAEKNVR